MPNEAPAAPKSGGVGKKIGNFLLYMLLILFLIYLLIGPVFNVTYRFFNENTFTFQKTDLSPVFFAHKVGGWASEIKTAFSSDSVEEDVQALDEDQTEDSAEVTSSGNDNKGKPKPTAEPAPLVKNLPKEESNLGRNIGIGVGVLVLVLIIFFFLMRRGGARKPAKSRRPDVTALDAATRGI